MKNTGLQVDVVPSCLAKAKKIRPGDRILEVNGKTVLDELDYRFHATSGRLALKVARAEGNTCKVLNVKRTEAEGLSFVPLQPARCRNRCIFCFIDQLPSGLRKSLYVKDEDARFSFLYGNYVTFASLTEEHLDRICLMRFSPLYVSVHATDPDVRNRMLGRKSSRDILGTLKRLAEHRIEVHTQIVLCPGVNDGQILEKTIRDLVAYHPCVASVAIVPVGLTRFRKEKGLYPLKGIQKAYSVKMINNINKIQAKLKVDYSSNFLYLSDEFYWKADAGFPPLSEYNDLPQWENGVGMVPLFFQQWKKQRKRTKRGKAPKGLRFVAVTGEMAYPYLLPYVRWASRTFGVPMSLVPVNNSFFGRQVKVAGLVTGRDIIKQLKGESMEGAILLLPHVMLNQEKGRFLDDVRLKDLEDQLRVPVMHFPSDPEGFVKTLRKSLKRFKTKN